MAKLPIKDIEADYLTVDDVFSQDKLRMQHSVKSLVTSIIRSHECDTSQTLAEFQTGDRRLHVECDREIRHYGKSRKTRLMSSRAHCGC